MAVAVAPRQREKPRQLAKRPVPDDSVVYREYAHQIMAKGEWGAKSRTARVCSVSDQHVINVIKRHEEASKPTPLVYEPAPGEIELANEIFLRQLLAPELPIIAPFVTSNTSSIPMPTEPQSPTFERDWIDIPYTFNFQRLPDRTKANQEYEVRLLALVALLLTIIDVLVSHKALGLSLMLLPEVLALWWVVVQMRRLVYWRK